MYHSTTAIILTSYNLKEADRLFRVYSEDLGKIACIGKGVKKITSRRGPHLDTLNLVKLDLYKKDSYYYITGSSLEENYKNIKNNLSLLSWSSYMIEALSLLTPDEEESSILFRSLKNSLESLNAKPSKRTVYRFLKLLVKTQGFWNDNYEKDHSYLRLIDSDTKVSDKNQILIDNFFAALIEGIAERKVNSLLLMRKI